MTVNKHFLRSYKKAIIFMGFRIIHCLEFYSQTPQSMVASGKSNFPLPCHFPSQNQPSKILPFFRYCFPLPCFRLFINWPSQAQPLWATILPFPQALLLMNSPSQTSPFAKTNFPLPVILSWRKVPSQTFWLAQIYLPRPCIIPLCIYPSQMFPFLKQYLPWPCFLPLQVSPSQTPSSSSIISFKYSKVFVTFFSPKISLGKFCSCQRMTLQALSAILSVGMLGYLPFVKMMSSSFMAKVLSSFFLKSCKASIPWQIFFLHEMISDMIFCTESTLQAWKYISLNGSMSYSRFSMSNLYLDFALSLSSSIALKTLSFKSTLMRSMSSSNSMRSSYFLNLSLTAKCSGRVGQLSIFQSSLRSSYLSVMRLYLHFSWVNSVRQTEQSSGHSRHAALRQTILTSSSLCFSFMHSSLDFRLSFDCGFIFKLRLLLIKGMPQQAQLQLSLIDLSFFDGLFIWLLEDNKN